MINFFDSYVAQLKEALSTIDSEEIERAYKLLQMYGGGGPGRIFVCGNGGSAAIAEHFSCDHTKGVRTDTFRTPQVISLSSNMALITAIANDLGYEEIFSYQMRTHNITAEDMLVVISASGSSPNVVEAFRLALNWNMRTIAMVGFNGGDVARHHQNNRRGSKLPLSAILHVKSENYGIIEDSHQILMHSLAQCLQKQHSLL